MLGIMVKRQGSGDDQTLIRFSHHCGLRCNSRHHFAVRVSYVLRSEKLHNIYRIAVHCCADAHGGEARLQYVGPVAG